jgi:hypothetical protein
MGKTRLLAEAVSGCAVPYLLIRGPRVLHDLLLQLAGMLACRMTGATSISLKPAILESLKYEPVRATRWATSGGCYGTRVKRSACSRSSAKAAGLFAAAVAAYKLDSLDLDGFRSQVLRSARGTPGQIVTMCRLAARPEYRHERHVKFLPLRMDALPVFIG